MRRGQRNKPTQGPKEPLMNYVDREFEKTKKERIKKAEQQLKKMGKPGVVITKSYGPR